MQLLLFFALASVNLNGWHDGYASGDWGYAYDQAEAALLTDSTSSDAWAALAFSAAALGYNGEASVYAQKAVELDSLSSMSWGALGIAYADTDEESLISFQKALGYDSTFVLGLVGEAHCFVIQERYSEALNKLTQAMNTDPDWISIWLETAEVYRYQQEFEKALNCVNTALKEWPRNRLLMSEAGWIMEIAGRYRTAAMIYSKIAETYTDDTGSLIDLGLLHESRYSYGEAIKAYRELQRRDPDNYWSFGETGMCLEAVGNNSAARESYLAGIEINPGYNFARYRLGLIAEGEGDIDKALEWYIECTGYDSSFVDAWTAQGLLYEDKGNFTAAETAYRKTLEIDPYNYWTWGELSLVLEGMGRIEEAGEALENGIAINSEYMWAWEQRGILFENDEDLVAAADWYRRAVSETVAPGSWILGELGLVLEQLGCEDSAAVYYSEAVSVDTAYIFGYQRLASILARRGNTEQALEIWQRYIEAGGFESTALCEKALIFESIGRDEEADSLTELIESDYPYAWIDLAWSYLKANPDESIDLALRAEEENRSDDSEFWIQMAGLYAGLERKDEAERSYERSAEVAPDSIDVWLEWGHYLFNADRDEDAAAKFRHATELDSLSFDAWSSLGEALLFSDQYDQALTALYKSLDLDPDSPWIYAYIGLAYENKGDSGNAMDYYFESLSIYPGYDYAEARIRAITDPGFDPDWNRRRSRRFNALLYINARVDNGNARERNYSGGLEVSFEYDTRGSEVSFQADYSFIETSRSYRTDYTRSSVSLGLERVLSDNYTLSTSSKWDRQPGTVRPWQISSYFSIAYTKWFNGWMWMSPSVGIGQVNTHWASGLETERTDRTTLYGSLSLWLTKDDSFWPSLWLWGNFYIPPEESENTIMNGLAELSITMWKPLSLSIGYRVGYERTPVYEYWEKYDTEFYSKLNLRLF